MTIWLLSAIPFYLSSGMMIALGFAGLFRSAISKDPFESFIIGLVSLPLGGTLLAAGLWLHGVPH